MGRLIKFARSETFHAVTKSERISNILFTDAARKVEYCFEETCLCLDVNRDGIKKEKVVKAVVRIKW